MSASSGARPRETLATNSVVTKSPKSTVRYQPIPTRHLRHRRSRSCAPASPPVAAVTRKAGSAMPGIDAREVTVLKANPSERSTGRASNPCSWRTVGRKIVYEMA
jgi:hypothetical protein